MYSWDVTQDAEPHSPLGLREGEEPEDMASGMEGLHQENTGAKKLKDCDRIRLMRYSKDINGYD